MKIILASKSPRRRELLSLIFKSFEIVETDIDETVDSSLSPRKRIEQISLKKAEAVNIISDDTCIISADTAVFLGDRQFGKPKNHTEAAEMLSALSGKTHSVITAYTVKANKKTVTKSVETKVTFRSLSEKEIEDYINTGEPFDKAGGYGIQSGGAVFCEKIEGDYPCVVGLPVSSLYVTLKEMGIIL